MKKYFRFAIIICSVFALFFLASTVPNKIDKEYEPIDYVNPYIGNISHLLVPTFPTIHLPNSLMRVYPERSDYTADLI
jgi:hypothetical protein